MQTNKEGGWLRVNFHTLGPTISSLSRSLTAHQLRREASWASRTMSGTRPRSAVGESGGMAQAPARTAAIDSDADQRAPRIVRNGTGCVGKFAFF